MVNSGIIACMRLDRFLTQQTRESGKAVRQWLLAGRVQVNEQVCRDGSLQVEPMQKISLDERVLQDQMARYYMLHKPQGVVSATIDEKHQTVLDLMPPALRADLHIAGRLDLNTTGLMLITNDGRWSRKVTQPETRIPKVYLVETEDKIETEYADVFRRGIYFAYEDLTTLPAQLEIVSDRRAKLTLYEGRYHQVKRMFGFFNNKVVGLHRAQIGELEMDAQLNAGEYRSLTNDEVKLFL